MPVLINDWDDKKKQPTTVYGTSCRRCGLGVKHEAPSTPDGWGKTQADGRAVDLCPECKDA